MNELLNLKEEQIQKSKKSSINNDEMVEKYKKKVQKIEGTYERKVKDLINEVYQLKKSNYLKN